MPGRMQGLSVRLRLMLSRITRRLWFRAALYAVIGIATALLGAVATPWLPKGMATQVGAAAVGNILGILASSMLAVTTFSLSIMVAAYGAAGSHATPRASILLIEDAASQGALSTFIGVFLFSVVGLIALSTGVYGDSGRLVLFGATVAMIVVIVVTLLRWIEQLSHLGRVGETIDRVERAARKALHARSEAPTLGASTYRTRPEHTVALPDERIGYVSHIDMARLQALASQHDLQLWVETVPGEFATPDQPLAYLSSTVDHDLAESLAKAFVITDQRDFEQDPRFGLVVLTEIAQRALSPAVNDPGTAIDVIGTATRLLCGWRDRLEQTPAEGDAPCPDVFMRPLDDHDFFDDVYAPLARDGAGLLEVAIRLQKSLATLGDAGPASWREAAAHHARRALTLAETSLTLESDLRRLRDIARWCKGSE